MGRSVLAGLLMGTILGGAIAATLSLQAAPPGEKLAAVKAAGAAPADAAPDEPAELEAPEAVAEAQPEVEAAPEAADAEAPAPETPVVEVPAGSEFAQAKPEEEAATPETEAPAEAATAPAVSAPAAEPAPDLAEVETAAQPEGQTEAPQAPEAPAAAETAAADLPAAEEQAAATAADAAPASEPAAADAAPAETAPEAGETAASEGAEPAAEPTDAEVAEAPAEAPADAPETAPSGEPAGEQLAAAETTEPTLPGTKVDQLPTIGAEASAAAPADQPALSEEELAALPPLVRYAAPFDRAGAGPTVSIVLLDVGEGRGGLDATAIQAISFPVTIALDAASANARERAADYRKAGFEIAIMAGNSLQRGMDAKDVAVAVESFVTNMPEAVAVIPAPDALFQIDRTVVRNLADALKADGLGLLTYARGLNVAGQAAESAGVPHASASRVVDEYKEDAATVQKALEKAAFEAGQKGSVVIVAHAYPESLKAIYDWVAGGPEGVTLAPASAPMIATRAGQ